VEPVWIVLLIGNGIFGPYLAYLWFHGHQHVILLQGSPHGLHGSVFLAYLAVVAVLSALSLWEILEGRWRTKVMFVLLDLGAFLVYHAALTGPQAYFASVVSVATMLNGVFLYPLVVFHVLGPLLEGRDANRGLYEVAGR
jgi:hypothetical protein